MEENLKLPETRRKWELEIQKAKLQSSTVHDLEFQSASKFTYHTYLALRALRTSQHATKFDPARFGLTEFLEKAKQELNGFADWKLFYDGIRSQFNHTNYSTLRNFSLVRYYQSLVAAIPVNENDDLNVVISPISTRTRLKLAQKDMGPVAQTSLRLQKLTFDDGALPDMDQPKTPPNKPSVEPGFSPISKDAERILFPPAKDEQIVNMALILLLNALTIHFPLLSYWTPHRKAFTVEFSKSKYEARVDGYLGNDDIGSPLAIVEVKSSIRTSRSNQMRMQETAQMVGWIVNSNNRSQWPGKYFQISQNRHQVYITFAEYDEGYVEYLKDGLLNGSAPFLTLHEFGPWKTTSAEDMEQLGPILLALSLRAEQYQRAA